MRKQMQKPAPVIHYLQKVKLVKKPSKKGLSTASAAARKRRPRKLIKYLTVPEKDRFFRVIDSVRDRAIFRLLFHHGLRASEIGKLEMSDFRQGTQMHLDRLLIHRLKGSISGETAMIPEAAKCLRAWVRTRGYLEGPLFPSREGGRITRCRIWQLMKKYGELAGLPPEKRFPHCLKHTCATQLLSQQKESIIDVQKHLGHAAIASTMVYAQLTSEANEARAKRLRDWK
jgi:type 1 fimbriae regulatory protein FimB